MLHYLQAQHIFALERVIQYHPPTPKRLVEDMFVCAAASRQRSRKLIHSRRARDAVAVEGVARQRSF